MGDNGFSQQRWMPKDLRPVVKQALDMGWTPKKTSAGGYTLMSPGKSAKFYLPITADNPADLAKHLNRLINKAYIMEEPHADTGMSGEELATVIDDIHDRGGKIRLGPSPTVECTLCHPSAEFSGWGAYAVHIDAAHPVQSDVEAPSTDAEQASGVTASDGGSGAPVEHVVNTPENTASAKMHDMEEAMQGTLRPWRAIKERNHDGTVLTYESSAVLEIVVVEDGVEKVIGYKCPVCPYTNDKPKGVVSHHANHVAKGEAPSTVESNYKTEPGEKYPQTVTKGPWVQARDEMDAVIYKAVHARHQGKSEADSLYARALADLIRADGYVVCPADAEPEGTSKAMALLDQIKALLGVDETSAEELAQAKAALDEATEALKTKEGELLAAQSELSEKVGFIKTLASFAKDEAGK